MSGCDTIATQLAGGPAFVVLDDAHGIAVGARVRVHGVAVGRVTEVGLVPEGARVVFDLAARDALHPDACGEVRIEGLEGQAYLHIEAGHAEGTWEAPLAACETASMDQTVAEAASLLEDLRHYVGALERGEQTLCRVETTVTAPAVPPPPPPPSEAPAPAPAPTSAEETTATAAPTE